MIYQPALDGLRGIAVLLVLFIHAQFALFPGGFLGVDLFFVLSGYLITHGLWHEYAQTQRIDLRAFYMRRALRLLPALLITLALAALMEWHRGNLSNSEIIRNALLALFYVANWARALFDIPLSKLDHTWSLSIEEQFYLLWPLTLGWLLRSFSPARILRGLMLLLIGLAFYRAWLYWPHHFARTYYGFDTRADAMMTGCLLACWLFWQRRPHTTHWRKLVPLWLIVFVALVAFTHYGQAIYPLGLSSLVAAGTALTLAEIVLHPTGWLARALSVAPLRYVGKISYGLYLYHFVLFSTTPPPIAHPIPIRQVLDFAATFGLAALSYHLVEIPCLRLKKRWQRQ
jgi:peptidoglycan/LPS O-acetylase OafA/YrhL